MPTAEASSTARILVVVNPVSGRGRGRAVSPPVVEALADRGRVRALETTRRGDAEAIAREHARSTDRIVVVGGDGTLNEVVNGLDGRDVPIGQVPVGGANVLARELGIPRDLPGALRVLRDGAPRRIDAGICRGRRFLLMVGVGFDADVIHRLSSGRGAKCGFRGYVRPLAATCRHYRLRGFSMEVDGAPFVAGAVQAIVANTRNYGGIAAVAASAAPDDGRLDVVALRSRSKLGLLVPAIRALRARVGASGAVVLGAGTRVAVDGDADTPVQVDGDSAGFLPIEVSIAPGSVRVLVPRRSS